MIDDAPDKTALRATARANRQAFVASIDLLAHRLAFKVLPSPLAQRLTDVDVVALYMGMDDEAPAQRLAVPLIAMGKTLALPRVVDRLGNMEFVVWTPEEQLFPGLYGTSHPQPSGPPVTPQAIVAPLLGFDGAMTRLGQGGGYYDRIFARFPQALRIGLAWSAQQFDTLPADPWDLPLDMVMTEVALIEGAA
ncbi:MAG: 5-formyltetrahydrofolate cyclo-ligase [Sphingobium sp.]